MGASCGGQEEKRLPDPFCTKYQYVLSTRMNMDAGFGATRPAPAKAPSTDSDRDKKPGVVCKAGGPLKAEKNPNLHKPAALFRHAQKLTFGSGSGLQPLWNSAFFTNSARQRASGFQPIRSLPNGSSLQNGDRSGTGAAGSQLQNRSIRQGQAAPRFPTEEPPPRPSDSSCLIPPFTAGSYNPVKFHHLPSKTGSRSGLQSEQEDPSMFAAH
jgi:hypothetical protein